MLQAELTTCSLRNNNETLKLKKMLFSKKCQTRLALHSNFYPVYEGINLSTSEKKIIQAITLIFQSWQSWQREFFFSSLINHFNKGQLQSLISAIESLFHRDFLAVCQNAYPMHRIKKRQHVHSSNVFDYYVTSKTIFSEKSLKDSKYKIGHQNRSLLNLNSNLKSETSVTKKVISTKKKFEKNCSENLLQEKILKYSKQHSQYSKGGIDDYSSTNNIDATENFKASSLSTFDEKKIPSEKSSCITIPSVWTMGHSVVSNSIGDYETQVTVDKKTEEYFPAISKPNLHSHFVVTPKMHVFDKFMQKFNVNRNKVPLPTTLQMHKNKRLWSSNQLTIASSNFRLKELFQKQISQIWQWINDWENHHKMRLLLHLLSFSHSEEQKFVGERIKKKFHEIKADERKNLSLPYKVWLKLVDFLEQADVESSELACQAWSDVLTNENFWITKCNEIAKKLMIPNLVELLSGKDSDNCDKRWRETYFMLRNYKKKVEHLPIVSNQTFKEYSGFQADDIISHFQSQKDSTDVSDSDSDSSYSQSNWRNNRLDKPFFPIFKEQFDVAKGQVKSKLQKLQEEQERQRILQEEERKNGFKQKRMEQIEEVMRDAQLPQDIKEKDNKKSKVIRTEKIKVNIMHDLLKPDEVDFTSQKSGYIAVDFSEKGTQSEKSWLSNTYVPHVASCFALKGHSGPVWCVLAHGKRVISGGLDRKIHFWARSGDCYASIGDCAKGGITCMAIGSDERCRTLYAGSWDRTISVYDSIRCEMLSLLTGHTDSISGLVVNSEFIISSSYDASIRVWDVNTHQLKRVFHPHSNSILCMGVREDSIITGGADRFVKVSCLTSGELLKEFKGHKGSVTAVKVRKNLIVSADSLGFVFFWSLKGATEAVHFFRAHKERINSIAFSSKRIFTASDDKQIKEWNLLTMNCVRTLQGHAKGVTDVKYTPDYLLTCSRDGSVRIWWWKNLEQDQKVDERKYLKKGSGSLSQMSFN